MPSITPIIYGIVGVLALIGALAGFSRGLYRQTVRTVTVILAAVLSFVAISMLYSSLLSELEGKTITDVIGILVEKGVLAADADTSLIENLDMKTAELVLALPIGLVVVPLIFVICFIVLSLILMIVHVIICALCGFKSHRNSFVTRLLGFLLGLVQGAAVAGLLLMPIIGIGNIARESVAVLESEASNEEFTETCSELYGTYAEEFVENPAISIYSTLGINALYERIATIDIDDSLEADLTKLAPDAALVATDVFKLRDAHMNNLSIDDERAVNSILRTIDDNEYFGEILSGLLRSTASAYVNGDIDFTLDDPFGALIDEAAKIFKTSTRDNLADDLDTISDVVFILSRDGILTAFNEGSDAMLSALTAKDEDGNTTVNKVINTIKENERTKPLVTVITKISLSVMAEETGMGENATETFESIKESINSDILTIKKEDYGEEGYDEYVADVSTAIDTMLKENEIELEKEIVDSMAEYVAENYSDVEKISDEEASDIILSYYDAYLEYLENGTVPDDVPLPELPRTEE